MGKVLLQATQKSLTSESNMSFRKLSDDELKSYGIVLNTPSSEVKSYLEKYYGDWARCVFIVDSEYNDEGYDNTISSVVVFDEAGNEIIAKNKLAVEARKNLPYIDINDGDGYNEASDIVYFNKSIELYVAE